MTYREPRTQSAYSTSLSDVQSTPTQVLGGRRSVVAPVAEMKEYSWPTRKVNIDFHAATLVVMEKENGTWTTSEMIMERPMMWQGGSGDAIYDQASEEIYVRYISQGGYNWYKLNESNGKISRVGRKSGLSDGLQWKIHDGCLFYRDINSKRYSGKIDLE